MWHDEIIEELKAGWEQYAAQFNHDLRAIYEDLKREEQASSHQVVSLSATRVAPEPIQLDEVEQVAPELVPEPEVVLPVLPPDFAST